LAELQLIAFPETDPEILFSAEDLVKHAEVFPEGTYVVLDGDKPVGMGAGIFVDFDFDNYQHTLHEIAGETGTEGHDPDGAYYYGTDISVNPDYRRQGIGNKLYDLRKEVVRRYNKKGIVAGGVLPGYKNHKDAMTVEEYVDKVVAGELYDPTLSFQLRNGFVVRGILRDYFHDERSGSVASLIYWENPDYQE
ncbi:MAG: GNAT family N-acetyltransferase, partial [Anaerolineales bacterium]|nr:GNAT family N-acetyltransferase [Anaerolineales bacterium]